MEFIREDIDEKLLVSIKLYDFLHRNTVEVLLEGVEVANIDFEWWLFALFLCAVFEHHVAA